MEMHGIWVRLLRAILRSRMEPVETVLSAHLFITGLWLIFPYWQTDRVLDVGVGQATIVVVGLSIATIALSSLLAMAFKRNGLSIAVRRTTTFLMFVSHVLLAGLAVSAAGFTEVRWLSYVALALLSAISYLSISLGVKNE